MNPCYESRHNMLMKAVVIYDHVAFATKVDSLLRLVGTRASVQAEWVVRCWPVKALNELVSARKALFESQDAHLVVCPLKYARSVPSGLFDWLKDWAQQREISDAALAFTAESNAAAPPQPVCSELSIFIHQHGLHLITSQRWTSENAMRIRVQFSSESETSVPLKRAGVDPLPPHIIRKHFFRTANLRAEPKTKRMRL